MTGEILPNTLDLISEYSDLDVKSSISNYKTQSFQSTIPIPSYLIAIVVGNVIQKQIGTRTYVITEPTQMDAASADLADLESYLTTLENYIGPYV
jgi:leukotriene-A4 hydrolase